MKTQKKKTFNLNKLQIAKLTLAQADFIKGRSIGNVASDEAENLCDG